MKHSISSTAFWFAAGVLAVQTAFVQLVPAQTPAPAATPDPKALYFDPKQPVEARVKDLLARMTTEQKEALVQGNPRAMFSTPGFADLGIPTRWLDDGPMGVRAEQLNNGGVRGVDDNSTSMPCGICNAASWDPTIAFLDGQTIGEEARARNKDIMLGPGVNIMRTPVNGRNLEYYGEDPFLSSRITVGYIEGEQSEDVASCVKHFVLNNQETNRNSVSVSVDERALREIYFPPFEAAVKEAKVWGVMASYNKVRGDWAAENDYTLNKVLKGEWGFQGVVISDWGAAHTTDGSVLGLDLEMNVQGTNYILGQNYLDGLLSGKYPITEADRAKFPAGTLVPPSLDDKATRNLRVMFSTKVLDPDRKTGSILTPEHLDASRRIAEAGFVLLKNSQNILPLDATKITKVAIIGDNAVHLQATGGQSSEIKTPNEVAPLPAIQQLLGDKVAVTFAQGYTTPNKPGARGGRRGAAATPPADPQQLVADAVAAAKAADVVIFVGGLNKNFDTEGSDRPDMKLPGGQDDLITQVISANPRTVVVIVAGSPVEMPWIDKVPAVLYAWYGGTKAGDAVANILFGKVNPSGKLPATFPKQLADSPAHALGAYPGTGGAGGGRRGGGAGAPAAPAAGAAAAVGAPAGAGAAAVAAAGGAAPDAAAPGGGRGGAGAGGGGRGGRGGRGAGGAGPTETYTEGLFVGYRWFDSKKEAAEPLFPFGFGLSYTTFAYSNIKLIPGADKNSLVSVQFDVKNTGAREGGEVTELYVKDMQHGPDDAVVPRPEKELKGFKKVFLKPGETQTITIPLDQRSFAYFHPDTDNAKQGWVAEAGDYKIEVGASSRDLKLDSTYHLPSTLFAKP